MLCGQGKLITVGMERFIERQKFLQDTRQKRERIWLNAYMRWSVTPLFIRDDIAKFIKSDAGRVVTISVFVIKLTKQHPMRWLSAREGVQNTGYAGF